jgi:hypothetical protein
VSPTTHKAKSHNPKSRARRRSRREAALLKAARDLAKSISWFEGRGRYKGKRSYFIAEYSLERTANKLGRLYKAVQLYRKAP